MGWGWRRCGSLAALSSSTWAPAIETSTQPAWTPLAAACVPGSPTLATTFFSREMPSLPGQGEGEG